MGPWTVLACEFHATALEAGEAFNFTDDHKNIRMGTHGVPPRLLSYTINQTGLAYPELTLKLGHDGIVSEEVRIQISEELARELIPGDGSIIVAEIERNKRED